MWFWRRKNDGFEWHKYVRTTIKLRRNERRKRIDQIKHDAAERVREAGHAGASAGRAGVALAGTGASALGAWLARLPSLTGRGAIAAWRGLAWSAGQTWRWLAPLLAAGCRGIAHLFGLLRRPGIAPLLGGAALAAALFVAYRWLTGDPQNEVAIGLVLMLVLGGLALVALVDRTPLSRANAYAARPFRALPLARMVPSRAVQRSLAAVVGGLVLAIGGWFGFQALWAGASPGVNPVGFLASVVPTGSETLKGRGRALSGDSLRVGGQVVRLSGIEAPEVTQACRTARGRSWSCGEIARRMLARITGNRPLTCEAQGASGATPRMGRCTTSDGKDVAQLIVAKGYAFATASLLSSSYAAAEKTARERKAGIWRGSADKPSEFRAKRWAAAKRSAPDGCPIKGRVVRDRKFYVLPWAKTYARVRVRKDRGERWFCSEAEAAAAGWKPSVSG